MAAAQRLLFLSTPSARRATRPAQKAADRPRISIHALREEGDCSVQHELHLLAYFYPRPPRGGRREPESRFCCCRKFLSTPSARRATGRDALVALCFEISIHALREEGDRRGRGTRRQSDNFYPRPPRGGRRLAENRSLKEAEFLSTPSARRATQGRGRAGLPQDISIHALREEGDGCRGCACPHRSYFYPRPPRGGRQAISGATGEEFEFLSTPSARRATAKTETKSLFSNKLYNILHEFRRALIYNGSKNYPNHAK